MAAWASLSDGFYRAAIGLGSQGVPDALSTCTPLISLSLYVHVMSGVQTCVFISRSRCPGPLVCFYLCPVQ